MAEADDALDDLRDELIAAAVSNAPDAFGAVSALFTAGFTLLIETVGQRHAVGAMRSIVNAAAERMVN